VPVQIPAGVSTGQYMTLRAVGNAGPRGGARGDVLVVFDVKEDPRFERDGEDLYCEVLVTFPQLVFGGDVTVPTVMGTVSMRVSPGTASGQILHLRGRGLPRVNGSGVGDLHVRVQLWTPDANALSDEERALVKRLGELATSPPHQAREKGFWTRMREALGA
jgi:molecular chaperone DnaJ